MVSRAIVLLLFLACSASPSNPKIKEIHCPDGTKLQPERREKILQLLRDASVEIIDGVMCFGELWPSRVVTDGPYLLDESATNEALAARLGHLAEHQKQSQLFDSPDAADCGAWVDKVLRAEARAYAIELMLRKKLSIQNKEYEFEEAFFQAQEQGEAIILRYLQEHPSGGGGIDALAAGYMTRCQQKKK